MISAIVKGRGFRGVLRYVLNPEKASLLGGTFGEGVTPEGIAGEFGRLRELNPRVEVPVFHGILSLGDGERLSDAVWIGVAQEYLEAMGYTDTPYVVARHTDTAHDHVHVIASRIRRDGSRVADSNDWRRSEALCRSFEERLGLRRVPSSGEVRRRRPTRGAQELALREGVAPAHARLQERVLRAAAGGPSLEVFVERLEAGGVSVSVRRREDGTPYGLSYGLDGVAFKASDLGRAYTLNGLARSAGLHWGAAVGLPGGPRAALPGGSGSEWSPEALASLSSRVARLPGRRGEIAEARGALRVEGGAALRGLLSAPSLALRLTSPRAALQALLRRLPGGRSLDLAFSLAGSFRSPAAALSLALRLSGYLEVRRPDPVEREIVRTYARAAASDRPGLETFRRRLAEVGIELAQDRQNLHFTLQGTTWTSRELGGHATLRGLGLEGTLHAGAGRADTRGAAGRPPGDPVVELPAARGGGARPPAPLGRGPVDPGRDLGPGPVGPRYDGRLAPGSDRPPPVGPPGPPPAGPAGDLGPGELPRSRRSPGAGPGGGDPPARGVSAGASPGRPLAGESSPGPLPAPLPRGPEGARPAPLLRRELGLQVALSGGRVDLRIEEPGVRPVTLPGLRRRDLRDELLARLEAAGGRGGRVLFRPAGPSFQVLRDLSAEAVERARRSGFGPALAIDTGSGRLDVVLRHPPGANRELRPILRRAARLAYGLEAGGAARPFLPAGTLGGRGWVVEAAGRVYPRGPALLSEIRRQRAAVQGALEAELSRLGLPSLSTLGSRLPHLGRRELQAVWTRQALAGGLGAEQVLNALSTSGGAANASLLRFVLRSCGRELGGEAVRRLLAQALPLPARALALAVGTLGRALGPRGR